MSTSASPGISRASVSRRELPERDLPSASSSGRAAERGRAAESSDTDYEVLPASGPSRRPVFARTGTLLQYPPAPSKAASLASGDDADFSWPPTEDEAVEATPTMPDFGLEDALISSSEDEPVREGIAIGSTAGPSHRQPSSPYGRSPDTVLARSVNLPARRRHLKKRPISRSLSLSSSPRTITLAREADNAFLQMLESVKVLDSLRAFAGVTSTALIPAADLGATIRPTVLTESEPEQPTPTVSTADLPSSWPSDHDEQPVAKPDDVKLTWFDWLRRKVGETAWTASIRGVLFGVSVTVLYNMLR